MKTQSEKNLVSRAMKAYLRKAAKSGGSTMQPSRPDVMTIGDRCYVVMSNINGVLAVYRVRTDGILKGLVRWPAEIEKAFA